MTHHSPLRPDSRPAVKGMSLADLTAGTHSVLPNSRDGTDRALPVSSTGAPAYSDPWLSAWRESQGRPVDAEPSLPDWPFTVNREGDIVSLVTGEVDPVLTAQLAMGIR